VTTKGDENELLRSVALQNATSIFIARQRAERRHEAYLAEAQRLSHTGSFGWTVSNGGFYWSDETFRIFQYDRTTIPTVELILQRVHPEDAALVRQTIERASQDGKDFDHEYRLVMPDGAVKHVKVVAHALNDGLGGIEFVGAVMDTTERKRAEEELRRSEALAEQRLRLVVDTTPALINSSRPDGYLDYVNKGWLDYFGFSLETALDRADVMKMSMPSTTDIHGSDWQPIIHPEDLPGFRDQWKSMLKSGKPGEREARVRRFDGEYRWLLFRAVPLYDETGKLVKWYGSAFDIEDRKRAEEALRRSESNLAEAQRLTHTGSWAFRVARRDASHLSEEWYRIYGFDPQKGPPPWEERLQGIHPEDRAKCLEVIDQAIAEKLEYEVEFRILLRDGTVKYIHTVGHPVLNASGDLVEFVGSSTDVTERKRAEVLLAGEKRLLEMIARGDSRALILKSACLLVEELASGSLSSILLLDPSANCLRHGAAPRLPITYTEAIDGCVIGPSVGSCGTAAYRAEPVIVSDIATDPLWAEYRDLALAHGLRACWSTPILSLAGGVLGTFVTYYREPRSPSQQEHNVIERITHLVSIAIEREQAEETLRRSESNLAEAQRLTHTGSWAWRIAGGDALHLSEEWYRIYGFDPEEGLSAWEQLLQRIHPEDRAKWQAAVDRAIGEKSDYEVEFRIVLPDGTVKHLHAVGHPVLNASGDLVQFVGSSMDITERKRAEEALLRSEGYLTEAQRLTRTGSWAWNVATRHSVYWSQENYRLFGFDPEGGIPADEAFYQRVHPEDRDRVRREVFVERPDKGSEFDVDFRIVLPEGAIRYIRSTGHPVRNRSGDLLEYVGTSIDVTERKRVDEERERLLASERAAFAEAVAAQQRFHDLVNSVEGIVWEAEVPSFQFLFISKQAERVLGYPVERWLSEPTFWKDHVHPEDREWALQFCQTATAEKRDHQFEYRMIAADGKVVWLRDLVTVVVEGDRVVRVRGVMVDLTNRKQAEEALRQAQADLAHVSRVTTMGELTASLAHEVKQPIAAAITNARTCLRWLAADTPNIEEARAAAMRIVKDQTRAAEIISRIRLLFNKGTPQRELVDVNDVIREMLVLLRGETTRYSVLVRTELMADLPQVMGDRVQLQQVMMNLIMNSNDAMKEVNGTRDLTIKSEQAENEQVLVSVSDTGVGIPPQQADQIFDAFFSTKPQGTGMGLRISRSIIESHGGRLWATHNSPRGASFCFTLPTKVEARE
jgi:PAS domain S-box-containing protein